MLRPLLLPDASLAQLNFADRQQGPLVGIRVPTGLLDELLQVTLPQLLVQPIDLLQSVLEIIRGMIRYQEEQTAVKPAP